MYISVLPAYVYMCYMNAGCLPESEEGVRSPEIGVGDGCEAPYGCWEMTLQEQVFLTAEPSLQPLQFIFSTKTFPSIKNEN